MASKQIGGLTAGTPIMADVIPKQIADASTEAEKVTFQQVSDLILPYRIYVAKITQSGTSAPSATVLQNTLGGTPVWSRTGTGTYVATLANAFTANTTVCFVNSAIPGFQYQAYPISVNAVELDQQNFADAPTDALFGNCIEIRVYI